MLILVLKKPEEKKRGLSMDKWITTELTRRYWEKT